MERFKSNIKKLLISKDPVRQYSDRYGRARFTVNIFKNYLKDSVLDVGCKDCLLKNYLSTDIKYVGVDIIGEPDFIIDLEKDKLKIFNNNTFHTVVCTEVLEHLDNFYDVFDELCRVSKKYIIISLPNTWAGFKYYFISGRNIETSNMYGLPLDKPKDRHKWFFNYTQAEQFLKERSRKNKFRMLNSFPEPIVINGIKNQIFSLFLKKYYGKEFGFENIFYRYIWALLKRD